MQLSYMNSLL